MKDIATTQTADLIAEWKGHRDFLYQLESDHAFDPILGDVREIAFQKAQMSTIAAELDRRLEVMDIEHGANFTEVVNYFVNPYDDIIDTEMVSKGLSDQEIKKIEINNLIELRDLLTWLLMKGGKG